MGDLYSDSESSTDLQVPWIAQKLNSLPRFDLAFHRVDSTFRLDSQQYKESLIVWAAAPFVWLLVTLILFLIYFCCRCCLQRRHDYEKKRHNVQCLRWSLAILTVISCVAIAVGFFGNESTNKGLEQALDAVREIVGTVRLVQLQMPLMNQSLVDISHEIDRMNQVYQDHPEVPSGVRSELYGSLDAVSEHAHNVLRSLSGIDRYASHINVEIIGHNIHICHDYSLYRYIAVLAFFGFLALLCIMLLIGIGISSKCGLLLFCAFGIFTLVQCWMLAGVHVGVGLMLGDFCTLDRINLLSSLELEQSHKDIIEYYMKCNTYSSPFKESLQSAHEHMKSANMSLNKVVNTTQKFISKSEFGGATQHMFAEFDRMLGIHMILTSQVECTNIRKYYIKSLESVCHTTLQNVMLLTISIAATGLLLSILVVLASLAWRHLGKHKGYLEGEDESGRFLNPPSDATSSHCSMPRGRQSQQSRDITTRRTTPPPAYNSCEFYRQYDDANSSDAGRFEHEPHV